MKRIQPLIYAVFALVSRARPMAHSWHNHPDFFQDGKLPEEPNEPSALIEPPDSKRHPDVIKTWKLPQESNTYHVMSAGVPVAYFLNQNNDLHIGLADGEYRRGYFAISDKHGCNFQAPLELIKGVPVDVKYNKGDLLHLMHMSRDRVPGAHLAGYEEIVRNSQGQLIFAPVPYESYPEGWFGEIITTEDYRKSAEWENQRRILLKRKLSVVNHHE